MFVASYHNTMRGIQRIRSERQPAPIYDIPQPLFPVPTPPTSSKEIIARVAAWHGYSYSDIVGISRLKPLIVARKDAIVAVKLAYPRLSLSALGRIFRRDHTTILHHLQRAGLS